MADPFWTIVNIYLPIFIILIVIKILFRLVTVMEYERGVVFNFGRFSEIAGGGVHLVFTPANRIRIVDIRNTVLAITGQEVLTSDGINVKVSMTAQYKVVDPEKAVIDLEDYQKSIYQVIQLALREIIGSLTIDELVESRTRFGEKLMGLCKDKIREFGIDLQLVDVKDLMLPADIRAIYSQIIHARKQAIAALERARGESASLRNLANSAKMLDDNPNLLQLRILNAMSESGNNTFVVSVGENSGLVPLKKAMDGEKFSDTNS